MSRQTTLDLGKGLLAFTLEKNGYEAYSLGGYTVAHLSDDADSEPLLIYQASKVFSGSDQESDSFRVNAPAIEKLERRGSQLADEHRLAVAFSGYDYNRAKLFSLVAPLDVIRENAGVGNLFSITEGGDIYYNLGKPHDLEGLVYSYWGNPAG